MPGEQKKVCIDVPYIDQSKLYPTGCESVSTVMLLRFLGIDITVDEFIEKYLEKKSFEERDGQVYGPDPHRYFCGSPYDDESFGCYAPVIKESLEHVLGEEYRKALNYCGKVSGKDADNKIKEAGLTPYFTDGTAGIEEADMIMVCKKMYHDEIKPECFDAGENDGKWYPQKDYHTMYIAEILKVLVRE